MKRYRHPKETRAMILTLLISIILSLFFVTVTFGCRLFLLGILVAWAGYKLIGTRSLERYIKVTPNNYPDLWQLVNTLQKKWQIETLDIYLNPTSEINASASDFGRDFIILNQGLLDTTQELSYLRFVIGHELGHIGLGHSWLRVIAYQLDNAYAYHWIGALFQFLLLRYFRMKELSADRIGLISCGNLGASIETLAAITLNKSRPSGSEIRQAVEYLRNGHTEVSDDIQELFSTHPDVFERVRELEIFAKEIGLSPKFPHSPK